MPLIANCVRYHKYLLVDFQEEYAFSLRKYVECTFNGTPALSPERATSLKELYGEYVFPAGAMDVFLRREQNLQECYKLLSATLLKQARSVSGSGFRTQHWQRFSDESDGVLFLWSAFPVSQLVRSPSPARRPQPKTNLAGREACAYSILPFCKMHFALAILALAGVTQRSTSRRQFQRQQGD